ncbi:MAG TPA: hypothetical protein VEW03_05555 [Longimicrobiaceae bacterium]|nr:hypothetical protein [Longimicrobiaceae bacterium]
MIWFGNLSQAFGIALDVPALGTGDESARMERALRAVAAYAPHLEGAALVDALASTGWVDRPTAARLLPCFRHFDRDRWFAESLRSLSLKGPLAADEFRSRVGRVVEDLTGNARVEDVGPEGAVRFSLGEREGIVLAYPQVQFTIGGSAAEAVQAAVEEMPDALVIVARNFRDDTRAQLSGMLSRTGVPGTLVTVNLLLGMRATALKYQPSPERVLDLLSVGRPLRTQDVAVLGEREAA